MGLVEFSELARANQERALARFCDAGPSDGYLYELDIDGMVLCRRKPRSASGTQRQGATE